MRKTGTTSTHQPLMSWRIPTTNTLHESTADQTVRVLLFESRSGRGGRCPTTRSSRPRLAFARPRLFTVNVRRQT